MGLATLTQRTQVLEDKTDRLETIFAAFMARTDESVARSEAALARTDESVARSEAALARTNESLARTEAARARTDESIARLERMIERREQEAARDREAAVRDREEMKRDREERKRDREERKREAARERKEMNQRMGELSNRMGTIVEDIVAPSIRRLAGEVFECGDLQSFSTRTVRTHGDDPSREREFDALYVGTRAVLLNETKATARPEYARAFVEFLESGQFARYVPEYRDLPIVPVFSSLSIPDDVVTYLTRRGIYAVAMGDEAMQVLNLQAVRSRRA